MQAAKAYIWTAYDIGNMGNAPYAKGQSKQAMSNKVSVTQIKPHLPQEIWRTIFDTMSIQDKLFSSKFIIEFEEFYSQMLTNYEQYAANFIDDEVERFALLGLKRQPDNSVNPMKFPGISFSIYLSNSR